MSIRDLSDSNPKLYETPDTSSAQGHNSVDMSHEVVFSMKPDDSLGI